MIPTWIAMKMMGKTLMSEDKINVRIEIKRDEDLAKQMQERFCKDPDNTSSYEGHISEAIDRVASDYKDTMNVSAEEARDIALENIKLELKKQRGDYSG